MKPTHPLPESALVLALGLSAVGCSPEANSAAASEPGPRNVILICWDTVRADHLGPYGYTERETTPFLDELAARPTVFEDASAASGWTKPSVPSFLTGTFPAEHGVYEGSAGFDLGKTTDVLPEESLTLAEVFQGRGYDTAAFIKNAQLRPGNGFEQGFDRYVDEAGDARDIRWQALDWLDQRDGEEPFFLYLHALDAHWPYAIPDEAATRYLDAEPVEWIQSRAYEDAVDAYHDGERTFTDEEWDAMHALYDGSLRFLDDQLRELFRGLELRGLEDDTIVILLSDHGEEFGEHGRIGHGHGLHENLLRVPLIFHVPGRESARHAHPVSLVDVFPTVLGLFGWEADVHPVAVDRLAEPSRRRPIFAEHKAPDRYLQSIRDQESLAKTVRSTRPHRPTAPTEGALAMPIGVQVEAKLVWEREGFYAKEVESGDEEDAGKVELKGVLETAAESGYRISQIPVHVTASTDLRWGDDVNDTELRAGRSVKLEGAFRDGAFHAERLKLYPADADAGLELRGPLLAGTLQEDATGTLTIGGLELRVDAWTDLDLPSAKKKRRMTREQVVEVVDGDASPEDYEVELTWYQLDADPDELDPRDDPAPLETLLDNLTRALGQRRLFDEDDRIHLTQDAIDALRAIGYAR